MSELLKGASDLDDAAAFLREACGALDDASKRLTPEWLDKLHNIPCQHSLAMVSIQIERLAGKILEREYRR